MLLCVQADIVISNRGSLLGIYGVRLREIFELVAGWSSCEVLFANIAASLMLPDFDLVSGSLPSKNVSGSPIGNFIHMFCFKQK